MPAFIVLCAVLATALLGIQYGVVLSILWGWFIVPVFEIPELSIPAATGSVYICTLLANIGKKSTNEVFDWGLAAGRPFYVLFLGWVLQFFM